MIQRKAPLPRDEQSADAILLNILADGQCKCGIQYQLLTLFKMFGRGRSKVVDATIRIVCVLFLRTLAHEWHSGRLAADASKDTPGEA